MMARVVWDIPLWTPSPTYTETLREAQVCLAGARYDGYWWGKHTRIV